MNDRFTPFHLSLANCRGREWNTCYPRRIEIRSLEDLETAVAFDHVAGLMKGETRAKDNFLGADVIMMDLDNAHSEDPATWKSLVDIEEALPGVEFYAVRSRNYMKEKRKVSSTGEVTFYQPREKYHLYFPLSRTITDEAEYQDLIMKIIGLFPWFDTAASDTAHFFFGVEDPHVEALGGEE